MAIVPPYPNPRITNVVHIPYFLGRPGADHDTHIVKFEITCAANDISAAKFQEIFVASLKENAFAWYQRQPPFSIYIALKNAFLPTLDHSDLLIVCRKNCEP